LCLCGFPSLIACRRFSSWATFEATSAPVPSTQAMTDADRSFNVSTDGEDTFDVFKTPKAFPPSTPAAAVNGRGVNGGGRMSLHSMKLFDPLMVSPAPGTSSATPGTLNATPVSLHQLNQSWVKAQTVDDDSSGMSDGPSSFVGCSSPPPPPPSALPPCNGSTPSPASPPQAGTSLLASPSKAIVNELKQQLESVREENEALKQENESLKQESATLKEVVLLLKAVNEDTLEAAAEAIRREKANVDNLLALMRGQQKPAS